jgi:hypothetical protein
MFPYKSNAFHAYETKRSPIKSRYFAYLIAIASIFGVLVFTEARAAVVTYAQCKSVEDKIPTFFQSLNYLEQEIERNQDDFEEISRLADIYEDTRGGLAEWATIYNAFCKD